MKTQVIYDNKISTKKVRLQDIKTIYWNYESEGIVWYIESEPNYFLNNEKINIICLIDRMPAYQYDYYTGEYFTSNETDIFNVLKLNTHERLSKEYLNSLVILGNTDDSSLNYLIIEENNYTYTQVFDKFVNKFNWYNVIEYLHEELFKMIKPINKNLTNIFFNKKTSSI